MEISYLGGTSFLIRDQQTVAINPPDVKSAADITLATLRRRGTRHIVNGPGEYEIGGVLIVSLSAGEGALLHGLEMAGINVVHHGRPGGKLEDRAIEALGSVDVLLLNADDLVAANEAVHDLQPKVVVPCGAHAGELCAELGVPEPRPETRFSWNGTAKLPKAVLLRTPGRRRAAA